jgi:hypothetical protein
MYTDEIVELPTLFGTYRLQIINDEDPASPREWDNLGTMSCAHRRYTLGDEQFRDVQEFMAGLAGVDTDSDGYSRATSRMDYNEQLQYLFDKALKKHVIMQLYLYDHSGISMSTRSFRGRAHHAEWDSGPVGFIHVSHEDIRKEYNWKKLTEKRILQIQTYLKGEVEVYDQFLRGDVYGFKLFTPPDKAQLIADELEEDDITEENIDRYCEEIDSCWGFYGHDWKTNGMEDHVSLTHIIERRIKEHVEQLKTWIRNKVPILKRQPLIAIEH